jgi:16S rRNA G1207 methylase RsmC
LPAGAGGNILSLVASAADTIGNLWPGNKRELESLLARAYQDDESGAWLAAAANIGSIASSAVSVFQNLFGGNKKRAEEFIDALHSGNKREVASMIARALPDDESGAWLGAAANIGSIASSAVSVFQNLFGGNKKRADELLDAWYSGNKREFESVLARALPDDESGAWLAAAANIGTIASSAVSVFQNLFGGNKRRAEEFINLMARAEVQPAVSIFNGKNWNYRHPITTNWNTMAGKRSLVDLD